jgi:hypothetical protein
VYPYLYEDCTYIISSVGGVDNDGEEVIADVVGRRDIEFVLRSSAAFSATAGSIIVECRDDFNVAHGNNNNDGDDDDDNDVAMAMMTTTTTTPGDRTEDGLSVRWEHQVLPKIGDV